MLPQRPWRVDDNQGSGPLRILAADPRATIVCEFSGSFKNPEVIETANYICKLVNEKLPSNAGDIVRAACGLAFADGERARTEMFKLLGETLQAASKEAEAAHVQHDIKMLPMPVGHTIGEDYNEARGTPAARKPRVVYELPAMKYPCTHPVFTDKEVYPYWHRTCSMCGVHIDTI